MVLTITLLVILCFLTVNGEIHNSRKVDTVVTSDLPCNLSFNFQREITADPNGNIVIRIGYINKVGMLRNDFKVLDISKQELIESGILQKNFNIEIVSQSGYDDSYEGVTMAAQMYYTEKVRAFFGPLYNEDLNVVAKMSSFWNIPVISYGDTTSVFQDKTIYNTLAIISPKTINSMTKATVKLILHYGWSQIAIVTNTGNTASKMVQIFEDEFLKASITVAIKIKLEKNWDVKKIVESRMLETLQDNARIVVCVFSSTQEMTLKFMQATFKANVNNNEYAYILPWLQSDVRDTSHLNDLHGLWWQQIKDNYANAIIIDNPNSFDNLMVENFIQKIGNFGLSRDDIDTEHILGYLYLYDALKLYVLAASKTFKSSGNAISSLTDGRLIWSNMQKMQFEGFMSHSNNTVVMDNLAERVSVFAAFFVASNQEKIIKMVNIESVPIKNCDSRSNKISCYDLKLTDIMTGFWPSKNGNMPTDRPPCGFDNPNCFYTLEISIAAIVLILVVSLVASYFIYRFCQNRALDKMPWRIFFDDLRMIDDTQARSLISLGSANTKLSSMSTGNKRHAIIGTNTHSTYHKCIQRRPIKFSRADLILLSQMKTAVHDNINPFLGIAFNEREELLVMWNFCSRGTVQDVIYNKNMTLDVNFHAAFIHDITLGLEYLHLSHIGYHGALCSWTCVIDRNFNVRLSEFGICDALERWEKEGAIFIEKVQDSDDKSTTSQLTSVLYQPPEQLKIRQNNRKRRMDEKWQTQNQANRQAADVYAFGVVMYEILYRSLPYPEGTDIGALVDSITSGSHHIRPQIQDKTKCHSDICALLMDCWNENPEVRPSLRRVRLNTKMALKTKGSLVDQMMRMMETYANNLEKLVQERTSMLEESNLKAERLLNQLLPQYVANELKLGRPVAPKLFESATVLFSDIVGFTKLCAKSSPLEVVNMLNGIYTGFDERIAKDGAYKVETIGDAYMVVSGIPEENGINHVNNIANIAINMRTFLSSFEVPHRKNESIKCRWGFHTGAVAAGVVGLTAPRYCLFGDTVNFASRMESTSLPELIQISQQSYTCLSTSFPEFKCEKRGEVEIKGKGLCTTYWLNEKVPIDDHATSQ